jgi:hypothetical protein
MTGAYLSRTKWIKGRRDERLHHRDGCMSVMSGMRLLTYVCGVSTLLPMRQPVEAPLLPLLGCS